MKFNILVVEDQKEISSIIVKYLAKEGYNFQIAENGFEALAIFSKTTFHLLLLDIMLPGIDGFQVLQEIRKVSQVPVIVLTARQEEMDRIKGFDIGADDYVIKPFSPRELMQRINVIFRRLYHNGEELVLQMNDLKLYTGSMRLEKKGQNINITSSEFKLLHAFMKNQGRVLTRDQLIQLSFGDDYDGYDRSIDTYIKRLRQKIEDDAKKPAILITRYGAGYVFGGEKE